MKLRILAFNLLLLVTRVSAQELSIFDVNDFVDPRDLGAVPTERGRFACPCTRLLIGRLMVGWDRDYVNVTRPTPFDVGFAHLATSYYSGAAQFNVKVSSVREVHRPTHTATAVTSRDIPREAVTLQVARYRSRGAGLSGSVGRVQLSWRISHYQEPAFRRDPDLPYERYIAYTKDILDHEYGVEYDVALPIFRRTFVGSLSYTALGGEHPTVTSASDRSRLAYTQRFPSISWRRLQLDTSIAAGIFGDGLRFKRFGQLTVRPSARLSVAIAKDISLNVRYAPAFHQHRPPRNVGGGYDWHDAHELAVFVDGVVFAVTR